MKVPYEVEEARAASAADAQKLKPEDEEHRDGLAALNFRTLSEKALTPERRARCALVFAAMVRMINGKRAKGVYGRRR